MPSETGLETTEDGWFAHTGMGERYRVAPIEELRERAETAALYRLTCSPHEWSDKDSLAMAAFIAALAISRGPFDSLAQAPYDVKERLQTQLVGKCTCGKKTPEINFHAADCTYAAAAMALDVIQLKDDLIDHQRGRIRGLMRPWWRKLLGLPWHHSDPP